MSGEESSEREFYHRLPALEAFEMLVDDRRYEPLPSSWWLILTDIEGSTAAVKEGRYKEVNLVGAACIIAVANALPGESIPAVFGGDGASLAVHESALPALRRAVAGVKAMARASFGLTLRTGAISVKEIREAGADVRIGRLTVKGRFGQAMFAGGGLHLAESWLKTPGDSHLWAEEGRLEDADFSGLECRWQPLETERGGYLCLLAMALQADAESRRHFYEGVLALVVQTLGSDPNPMLASRIELVRNAEALMPETKVVMKGKPPVWQRLRAFAALTQTRIGGQFMKRGIRLPGADLPRYQAELPRHTDYRKFDDALRMVVAASEAEVTAIRAGLTELCADGQGVFGTHLSRQALLTCMVLDRQERHLHFIDGADGGYVLAAKELKGQLRGR